MNYASFALVIIILAFHLYKDRKYEKRIDSLLDRLMAKDYGEFKYFRDKWGKDVEEVAKLRKEARKERNAPEDEKEGESEKVDLTEFEEDWKEEGDETKGAA